MGKHKFTADLAMPIAQYWYEKDTAAFRALQCTVLDLKDISVRETKTLDNGDSFVLLRTIPNVEIPGIFVKTLGGKEFVFDDELTYPASVPPYVTKIKSIPPVFPNKANIVSTLTCVETGPDSCRQTLEVEIKINVFGVSGLVEDIVVDGLRKSYGLLPKLVDEWKIQRKSLPEYQAEAGAAPAGLASLSCTFEDGFAEMTLEPAQGAKPAGPLASGSISFAQFTKTHDKGVLNDASKQWNSEVKDRKKKLARKVTMSSQPLFSTDDMAKYAKRLEQIEVEGGLAEEK